VYEHRFHLSPVVVTLWADDPTGIREHHRWLVTRSTGTCIVCFPGRNNHVTESPLNRKTLQLSFCDLYSVFRLAMTWSKRPEVSWNTTTSWILRCVITGCSTAMAFVKSVASWSGVWTFGVVLKKSTVSSVIESKSPVITSSGSSGVVGAEPLAFFDIAWATTKSRQWLEPPSTAHRTAAKRDRKMLAG